MIPFLHPKDEVKDADNCLDAQLWRACAGGMVQMPPVDSKVFYFVQGHIEHANGNIDFRNFPRIPPCILCRVEAIKYIVDYETDGVYAKIRLAPEPEYGDDDGGVNGSESQDNKPASFAKTLTQSDANNGGGFSVPRYCAETIFPRLDNSADPPVQNILAKDMHGWSTFVNAKKLVAGDLVVFLRAENGDLFVGIRRVKRGIGSGHESLSGWNSMASFMRYGGLSSLVKDDDDKLTRNGKSSSSSSVGNMTGKGKVRAETVGQVASYAANGLLF
ncbi:hypothetical protein Nepgr_011630 [Nepenthes gracilis]|uniref:TF-B3 domain-containing protein n=1 Tax=Nepenthes gracilis TaxID=150966 RepID=A0AAD3SF73_NEPGR|nr:hypothetical protein Nepgr_011630 [Nepenthes gracilis]